MSEQWQPFALYSNAASAEAVAGRLRAEAVPVRIVIDQPVPGLTQAVRLLVPSALLHRVQWILAQSQFSDEELCDVALRAVSIDSCSPSDKTDIRSEEK